MTATYTKLNSGDWGVRVQGSAKAGDQITVTKKSGESKVETIAKVVWSGNGISLCAIGQRQTSYASYGNRSRGGAAAPVPGFSSWCTGRDGCRCYDCAS